ncbi:O-antigen polymerase [Candidatus Thiomargarita nelsonii]|uniref:O-antigen polymerase n=1 Tax=Candidatus Thiomargarita nelsonii TaxID=1003181 RepID=A0A176S5K1_9GAMM|nr:O-antigen polymerase [Candidatus Thiomargarita nelsonii]
MALALPIAEALKQISVIVIILLGIHLIFKKELKIEENLLTYSAVGLVIFSLISACFAFNTTEALKACIDIFRILLIFLIIKSIPLNINQLVIFNKILFLSMIVALLYGLYQFHFFPNPSPDEITYLELHSIGHVNHSSIYLLLVFTIALTWLFYRDNRFPNISTSFLLFIIISSLAGIFITGSRATMFTSLLLMLLIFLLFFITKQYRNTKLLVILAILSIIPLIVLFSSEYSLERLLWGFNMIHRDALMEASIRAWLEHNIFFGIGADNSHHINPQDYVESVFPVIPHAHNTYITFLLERGLFGLSLYVIFIFSVLIALLKQYAKTKDRLVTAALLIWLVNFLISSVNTTFHDENGLLMVLIWGLALNQHLTGTPCTPDSSQS